MEVVARGGGGGERERGGGGGTRVRFCLSVPVRSPQRGHQPGFTSVTRRESRRCIQVYNTFSRVLTPSIGRYTECTESVPVEHDAVPRPFTSEAGYRLAPFSKEKDGTRYERKGQGASPCVRSLSTSHGSYFKRNFIP